jgi:hypothetical protein
MVNGEYRLVANASPYSEELLHAARFKLYA